MSDSNNYGTDANAADLLFPSQFSAIGVHDEDFTKQRPPSTIRKIFENIGQSFTDDEFVRVWWRAATAGDINGDGIITFKEFSKILYGRDDAEALNWNYHKANERLVKTRYDQQQSRVIKTGAALRARLQQQATHVARGDDGPLRGIEVGARVDLSSAKNIMRRYHIMHTAAALQEMLE